MRENDLRWLMLTRRSSGSVHEMIFHFEAASIASSNGFRTEEGFTPTMMDDN
jgi:hypothetical protein